MGTYSYLPTQSAFVSCERQVKNIHAPKKRGIKSGTKLTAVNSLDDWFEARTLYRSKYKHMKQSALLKSNASGDFFIGKKSEQKSFSAKLKLFNKNELKSGLFTRQRKREFDDVEDRLIH